MLTQEGWKEPTRKKICHDCGKVFELVGVFDVREDSNFCYECEQKQEEQEEEDNENVMG